MVVVGVSGLRATCTNAPSRLRFALLARRRITRAVRVGGVRCFQGGWTARRSNPGANHRLTTSEGGRLAGPDQTLGLPWAGDGQRRWTTAALSLATGDHLPSCYSTAPQRDQVPRTGLRQGWHPGHSMPVSSYLLSEAHCRPCRAGPSIPATHGFARLRLPVRRRRRPAGEGY